jgi:hypothetical protein
MRICQVTIVQTILDWTYTPNDFFETPVERQTSDFELSAADGKITVHLHPPVDPVPDTLVESVNVYIDAIFKARAMRTHHPHTIDGPGICHLRDNGGRDFIVKVKPIAVIASMGTVDFIATDASGKVIADSKAERISRDETFNRLFEDASAKHPLVTALLTSYQAAIADPENELVHLYEIRDALRDHFGSIKQAKIQLGITDADWDRFNALANDEPLLEGRHRGRHIGLLRSATQVELQEARGIIIRWLEAFARSV